MEKTTTNAKTSQGDKVAVDRVPSTTYTIKSLAGNIRKVEKLKLCTAEELTQLKNIHKGILQKWISLGMEL